MLRVVKLVSEGLYRLRARRAHLKVRDQTKMDFFVIYIICYDLYKVYVRLL